MQIIPIDRNGAELSRFVGFARELHRSDKAWIAPLDASLARELSDAGSFFRHGGEAQLFLAIGSGSHVLGRIGASVDPRLQGSNQVGHLGYFECIDDVKIARALFETAELWLRERGKTEIHGPMQLNIYTGYRLQTSGFTTEPFLGEPRCPSYYPALWEACGYTALESWGSWDLSREQLGLIGTAVAARVRDLPAGCEFRPFQASRVHEDFRVMHPAIMDYFSENYGFSPLTPEEYAEHNSLTPALITEGCGWIEGPGGQALGFSYGYADRKAPFVEARGDIARIDFAGLAGTSAETGVLHSFGVRADHRKTGLTEFLVLRGVEGLLRSGYPRFVGALCKQGRTVFDRLGPATRTYAVYSRRILA